MNIEEFYDMDNPIKLFLSLPSLWFRLTFVSIGELFGILDTLKKKKYIRYEYTKVQHMVFDNPMEDITLPKDCKGVWYSLTDKGFWSYFITDDEDELEEI